MHTDLLRKARWNDCARLSNRRWYGVVLLVLVTAATCAGNEFSDYLRRDREAFDRFQKRLPTAPPSLIAGRAGAQTAGVALDTELDPDDADRTLDAGAGVSLTIPGGALEPAGDSRSASAGESTKSLNDISRILLGSRSGRRRIAG